VLKSFMKNLFMTKSSELTSDFFTQQTLKPPSHKTLKILFDCNSLEP